MEYTTNAKVKKAIERAHAERGLVLRAFWARLFHRKLVPVSAGVSRWA